MRVLFIGDVFGQPGRKSLETLLPQLMGELHPDFCVVNGENAAHGKGINQKIAKFIFSLGVDAITLGNHAWDNKDIFNFIDSEPRLIRPYNFPPNVPGYGLITLNNKGRSLVITQLIGRLFMTPVDCPFQAADSLLNSLPPNQAVIIDMHAEATSEKSALGWYVDGRASAVVGTHTHVATADERLLPQGTAYITDAGMTGAHDSVIGMDVDTTLLRFKQAIRVPFEIAENNLQLHAVCLEIDDFSGRALSIQRISSHLQEGEEASSN